MCRRVSVARQLLTPPGNWASLSATTLTGVCLHRLVQRLYLRLAGRRLLGCSHSCYRHDSLLLIGSSCPSLFALALHPSVTEAVRIEESRFPGELDYNSSLLDGGIIAGRSPAVQQIIATLEERLLEIGLRIARHRTRVVSAGTSVQNFSPHDFEGFAWVPDGNVKLLGAALGSQSWCKALLKRRVVMARNLLDAIGRFPDAQCAFTLWRLGQCALLLLDGTPPLQAEGLNQAEQDIRHSFGRLVGSSLSDDDWRVASIGVANGGLGARSVLEHARAAYVPSLAQTKGLCTRIWPGFDEYDLDGGYMRSDVESSLGAS